MKKLLFLFFMGVGVISASAQSTNSAVSEQPETSRNCFCERKPVTIKFSSISGDAEYANHYLNSQEYTGELTGFEGIFGRYYRKSDRLSWKLTLTHLRNMYRSSLQLGGLVNAANTSHISFQNYEADYAVFYNWLVKERLQLRVGGSFNFFGGFLMGDEYAINNILSVDLQTQFYAHAQVRYGWEFKKYGLDIYANIASPFMGMMVVDERYESSIESILTSDFNLKEHGHLKLSSMHNLQGVNFEMGVDFAFRNYTFSMAYETKNRWWNAYELQNYRKHSLIKLGVSMNLFNQQNRKISERYF